MTDYATIYDVDNRGTAFEVHDRGVLACVAGPGTGKTRSLLARYGALRAREVPPAAIAYLTFIRAISDAFQRDFVDRFGGPAAADCPRMSTLHSLACRLLRNWGFKVGYDGELYFANIADHDEAGETCLADLLRLVARDGCGTVSQLRASVERIQSAWQDRIAVDTLEASLGEIAQKLRGMLRAYRLADFNEAVELAIALLDDDEAWPDWLQELKHYFVDEYQDFNKAEQEFIRILIGAADSAVIVGDDNQSLYSSRGGSPEGMLSAVSAPWNDRVSLVKCFRCPGAIVQRTNQFQLGMSTPPRSMMVVRAGGDVRSLCFKSSKAEIAFLVSYLRERLKEAPANPRPSDRIVCLFPTRKVLRAYYERLGPELPCEGAVGSISHERRTLRRLLSLVPRPTQRFQQRLLLNEFKAIKPRHVDRLIHRVLERDEPPVEAMRALSAESAFAGSALTAAREYVNLVDAVAAGDGSFTASWASARTGTNRAAVAAQIAVVSSVDEDVETCIEAALDELFPATAAPPDNLLSVQFLTMHGAKGLTRRVVVLPGLEEAWLPGSATGGAPEEKERLFYVALSRATDHLLLTIPLSRARGDPLNYNAAGRGKPSSFLRRAGLNPTYAE